LRFGLVLHPQFPPDVYLEGAICRQSGLSREHQGPRAVLNALERLATGYGSEVLRVRQDLGIAEAQLRDYQARLGKPFTLEGYLVELTELRDRLKAKLSAGHDSGEDRGPSTSELAEKIKALKSANSVEATPQRVRQKHTAAEEPITARIRRRQGAGYFAQEIDAGDGPGRAATLPAAAEPANDNHHAANDNRPPLSFTERIARERQRQDDGPSLP
jgi:hypothetical protein